MSIFEEYGAFNRQNIKTEVRNMRLNMLGL